MIKKVVKYVDYDGVEREEAFYFNLNKAEVLEMELSGGKKGLTGYIERIVEAQDSKALIKVFKELLLKAYGEKSPDGKFVKSEQLRQDFESSAAYSEIFTELATNTQAAIAFFNGIIPTVPSEPVNKS